MTITRAQVRELSGKLKEAGELGDREQWPAARDAFLAIIREAERLGVESAHVWLRLATVYLEMGEAEEAFAAASKAVMLDAVGPDVSGPFLAACGMMRDELERRSETASDDAPPRLYAALAAAGETDVRCHVALARHHLANGRAKDARELLEATTLLDPVATDAWAMLARVEEREGNAAKARELEARVQALKEAATPFGIPGPTATC